MAKSTIVLSIVTLLLLTSCFKELVDDINNIDNLQWNPKLALPLANGSFTITEFAEELSGDNFTTTTRDDGLVVFIYSQDQVFSEYAEDLVNIQDENYNATLRPTSTSIPDLAINGSITTQEIHEFNVSTVENDKLYSAKLKGGSLEIDLNGNFPTSGELLLTFHGLTNDGVTLETLFQWNYDGSNAQQFQRSIDLTGLDIDFTNNGTTYNYFHFTSTLTLNYEGQAVTSTEGIDLNMDLLSMEFSQATATISQRTVAAEADTFSLNFMDELRGGVYYFDEPAINFNFANSFGVPLDASILEVTAHSDTKGDLSLTGNIVGNPFSIGYPSMNEMGTVVQTELSINHENSNLPDILAWQPNTISYSFEGIVNPNANDEVHFVLDTSRIGADINLELPMIGRFRNLTFTENYDFNGSDLEEVEYALFRLYSSNGFPINADVQLYFLNSTGTLIDSLIYDDRKVLEAGLTDNNGKVTSPTEKNIDVLIPSDRLVPISAASSLLLRATLDTPENETRSVRIYDVDRLTIKLAVQTEFEIIL